MSIKRRLITLEKSIPRKLPRVEELQFVEPTLQELETLRRELYMPPGVFRELFGKRYDKLKAVSVDGTN